MENRKVVLTISIEIDAEKFLSTNFEDAFDAVKELGEVTLKSVKSGEVVEEEV